MNSIALNNSSASSSADLSSPNVTSASDSDTSSTKSRKRRFEATKITSEIINLPKGLCQDQRIFEEFFSLRTWNCLSDPIRKHLSSFLPMFPENTERENLCTIQALFKREILRFGACPFIKLRSNMEEGNYMPEISILNKSVLKAQRHEYRYQEQNSLRLLAHKIAVSRERALCKVYRNMAPVSKPTSYNQISSPSFYSINNLRVEKKYLQELYWINNQLGFPDVLSETETWCDTNTPYYLPRKQRRLFGTMQIGTSISGADNRIADTLGLMEDQTTISYLRGSNGKLFITDGHYKELLIQHKKRKIEEPTNPELDCQEIKLKDVVFRTQACSGYRRIMPISKGSVADGVALFNENNCSWIDSCASLSRNSASNSLSIMKRLPNVETITVQSTSDELSDDSSNMRVEGSTDITYCGKSTQPNKYNKQIQEMTLSDTTNVLGTTTLAQLDIPSESNSFDSLSQRDESLSEMKKVKSKPTEKSETQEKELESIQYADVEKRTGVWSFKTDKNNEKYEATLECNINYVAQSYETLLDKSMLQVIKETHNCFLSLVRDMFYSTLDHRLTIDELKRKLDIWLHTPTSVKNDWYNLANDNWEDMLQSAIFFLSGEFSNQPDDFVPYIEYKVQLDIYQWIGASRDSDHRLQDLCNYWLSRKHEMGMETQPDALGMINSKQKCSITNSNNNTEDDDGSSERTVSPPPPRFPTDWSVRKATNEEIKLFRDQEKCRYENPHMAFTYKQHSYHSVVGPVKGIYTQAPGISKARGHSMLVADRPNFVTILTLVRDATARLPNGEGTRSDICELLKSSQYISPTATDQVLQTIVSGALDRMHTEYDPCVKYDTKRKIWIYLHRNRTEEEFERRHHQYQGIAKHKKSIHKKKMKESSVMETGKSIFEPNLKSNSQSSLESEGVNSDSALEGSYVYKGSIPESKTYSVSDSKTHSLQIPASKPLSSVVSDELQSESYNITHSLRIRNIDTGNAKIITHSSPVIIATQKEIAIRANSLCKVKQVQLNNPEKNAVNKVDNIPQNNIVSTADKDGNPSLLSANKTLSMTPLNNLQAAHSVKPENICSVFPIKNKKEESLGETMTNSVETRCKTSSFIMPASLNQEIRQQNKLNSSSVSLKIQAPLVSSSEIGKDTPILQTVKQGTGFPPCTSNMRIVQSDSNIVSAERNTCEALANPTAATAVRAKLHAESTFPPETASIHSSPKGQQSILTLAQQKQILENLLVQQNKYSLIPKTISGPQRVASSTGNAFTVSSNKLCHISQSRTQAKAILKKIQKAPTVNLSNISSIKTTPAIYQTIATSNSVIRISTPNTSCTSSDIKAEPDSGVEKEQSESKIVKHLKRPLISKIASIPTTNDDVNIVKPTTNNILVGQAKSSTVSIQTGSSGISRIGRSPASSIGQSSFHQSLIDTFHIAQIPSEIITERVKDSDDVVPRRNITEPTTVQLAAPKPSKANLIQLSNHSYVSPIAQYTVVSQNKKVITAPQCVTQRSTQQNVTTAVNKFIDSTSAKVLSSKQRNNIIVGIQPPPNKCTVNDNSQNVDFQQSAKNQHLQNIQQVFTKIVRTTQASTSFINTPSLSIASIGSPLIITSKAAIRSEDVQQTTSSIVFSNSSPSTESSNIIYGGQAINLISRDNTNLVSSQPTNDSVSQKILVGNPLLKVRAVSRQQPHMKLSFAQQSIGNGRTTAIPMNISSSISNISVESNQQRNLSCTNAISDITPRHTSMKMVPKVGIRLNQHAHRVVLSTQGSRFFTQQILMPPNFQAGSFNIKRLKVIPVNNHSKGPIVRSPCVATPTNKLQTAVISTTTTPNIITSAAVEDNHKLLRVGSINDTDEEESNAK